MGLLALVGTTVWAGPGPAFFHSRKADQKFLSYLNMIRFQKIVWVWLFLLLVQGAACHAAISPLYKACMQRGYAVEGDSCRMPDGSLCHLEDFNAGRCGKAFFDEPYCIPEGRMVWEAEKCCEGLVAWLPEGVSGQMKCVPESVQDPGAAVFSSPWYWAGVGMLMAIIGIELIRRIRRSKKGADS